MGPRTILLLTFGLYCFLGAVAAGHHQLQLEGNRPSRHRQLRVERQNCRGNCSAGQIAEAGQPAEVAFLPTPQPLAIDVASFTPKCPQGLTFIPGLGCKKIKVGCVRGYSVVGKECVRKKNTYKKPKPKKSRALKLRYMAHY